LQVGNPLCCFRGRLPALGEALLVQGRKPEEPTSCRLLATSFGAPSERKKSLMSNS